MGYLGLPILVFHPTTKKFSTKALLKMTDSGIKTSVKSNMTIKFTYDVKKFKFG